MSCGYKFRCQACSSERIVSALPYDHPDWDLIFPVNMRPNMDATKTCQCGGTMKVKRIGVKIGVKIKDMIREETA